MNASGVAQVATVRLLVEDPDLAERVPLGQRDAAIAACQVPLLTVPPGVWQAPRSSAPGDLGLLVLDGICLRAFELDQRRGVVLLGPGDLIKPWSTTPDGSENARATQWRCLTPLRLAVLDGRFVTQIGDYPELAGELIERVLERNRELVMHLAIAAQTRVDTRLHLMLWQMAAKWGRMRPDGLLLPLRLTHTVLSELVASRRPTITTALAELSQRGLVQRVEQGWLLRGDPPEELAL
ncbi:helix-turn-helix domain-containing protein [Conexibacter sp. DBS9H8]|uniref:helix-turn-helix domain-containing protein n=1 Tax=Conexibacter sp. DBS9H8 TaxID=2937801 RepID=UPI00200E508B|nr:helix-turn-helix domain-containing protein [Conexibacter sp. DBS9H8]